MTPRRRQVPPPVHWPAGPASWSTGLAARQAFQVNNCAVAALVLHLQMGGHGLRLRAQVATLLVAGLALVGCTPDEPQDPSADTHFVVPTEGGTIGHPDGPALLTIPQQQGAGSVEVTITATPSSTSELAGALPLGPPVEISSEGELTGAAIRMPFDSSELPTRGGRNATVKNAFIAVYNERLGFWVPLETTYDATSRQLVAATPHLSRFQKWVVDPADRFWEAGITGLRHTVRGVKTTFRETFDPEPETISCSNKLRRQWWVTIDNEHFKGCVVEAKPLELRLQNDLRVPVAVTPPPGLNTQPQPDDSIDAVGILSRFLAEQTNQAVIVGRGRATIGLPNSFLNQYRDMQLTITPDPLALAVGFVIASLDWIPPARTFKFTLQSVSHEVLVQVYRDGATIEERIRILQRVIEKRIAKPDELDAAGISFDAFSCVVSAFQADEKMTAASTSHDEAVQAGSAFAKECVKTALEAYEKRIGKSVKELLNVAASIPSSWGAIATLGEATRLGIENLGGRVTVRVHGPNECGYVGRRQSDDGLFNVVSYGYDCKDLKPILFDVYLAKFTVEDLGFKCANSPPISNLNLTTCKNSKGLGFEYETIG
jgi:hypothetical protein